MKKILRISKLKSSNNIPTLQAEEFRQTLMSYDDNSLFETENFNDFFIHDLSAPNYKLKLPQPLYRNTANSLLIITNGKAIKSAGLDNYTISNNSILLVPAGHITATSEISKNASGFWLHFSDNFLSHTNIDISDWLAKPVIHFDENEMQNLIVLLKRMEALNVNPQNTELIKLYLATFLAEIKKSADFSQSKQFTAPERVTLKFKRLLNLNVSKQKSVSFYAQELNVSPSHLNKSVKAILGKSASQLIDEMLLLEAKVLIRKNKMSFSEIAFQIGFEDPSYFGRFFKKHTGFSPTEFRKMIDLSE
ncbi:helix-turn-helix domain-containing protein [Kaistella sp.]|uniref:helix-turn-helix domain-containing protein n=1 Tax=Kaistella sp. TaxID=2782235 RepID=UPI003C595E24